MKNPNNKNYARADCSEGNVKDVNAIGKWLCLNCSALFEGKGSTRCPRCNISSMMTKRC